MLLYWHGGDVFSSNTTKADFYGGRDPYDGDKVS